MTRITEEQARVIARQIEVLLCIGNNDGAQNVLQHAIDEAKRTRSQIFESYDHPGDVPISELQLGQRLLESLESEGHVFVRSLLALTPTQVHAIPQIGTIGAMRIRDSVKALVREFRQYKDDISTSRGAKNRASQRT